MKARDARLAIRAILESVDQSDLPKAKIEKRDNGETLAWFGGRGHYVGTATNAGERDPDVHRSGGVYDALVGESLARLDAKHLKKERAAPSPENQEQPES